MAGSYEHILTGWSLIENMGDAREAVEELLWLIQTEIGATRARQMLEDKYYPMCRGDMDESPALISVQKTMDR